MAKQPKQAIKEAPVATLTTIESVVGFVLTFLVSHHVIGHINVSAMTQTIAPFVALVLPAIFGAAKWRLVSPVEKIDDVVSRDGLLSDADLARIDAMLDEKVAGVPSAGDLDVEPSLPRQILRPLGMSAGYPSHSGVA